MMTFDSLAYVFFLSAVYLLFNLAGERVRWVLLLLASTCFYATLRVPYLLAVLSVVIVFTFSIGIAFAHCTNNRFKNAVFWSGIAGNVSILVGIKCLPFISHKINTLFGTNFLVGQGLVSIGVSYFTFQAISYLVDIYLEIEEPERHLGLFAVYMAFFPKLLQGPIERAGSFLPQLKKQYEFDYDNMRTGMLLFLWGLFKKVVVADRLALLVDNVYGNVHSYTGPTLILATYCYAFQIYCDFSGYTDMALGSARIFNINLTQNFSRPYLATSVADFWRRWHISFSKWILDYIFRPLQMLWRDWGTKGTVLALVVTFLVSGVWHGASWCFLAWGGLHGIYLASSVYYRPIQKKIHKAFGLEKSRLLTMWQLCITFHLICLAWIFFRASSIADALYVVKYSVWPLLVQIKNLKFSRIVPAGVWENYDYVVLAISFLAMASYDLICKINPKKIPLVLRWSFYYAVIYFIVFAGIFNHEKYIYFQF